MIQVNYSNMMKYKEDVTRKCLLSTFQPKGKSVIDLDYNNITFNEALSFPYSVPNGYNRIIIK
jgi:predicted 3-demethylubiquinone-9 3-methyltransferase (glyoxalase superfamily)